MDLAWRLWELRNIRGLTLLELGERFGLAFTYISRLENRRIASSLALIERLAKELEVAVYQFFRDDGAKLEAAKPFPYGGEERTHLRVFHGLSCEDKSLLLSMARKLAPQASEKPKANSVEP
jgi:transcriptional regulator with XRE-family HTH domain